MSEGEQRSCRYEHCQRPLEEIKAGHRRKEYCDDKCRQAAHRLRVKREQGAKKVSLDYYLTKYHSPRLLTILEGVLREQGASDLLRLVVAIDEECTHVLGSDASSARVTYLQMQLSEYRAIVDLDEREKLGQQFMVQGQMLDYRAIDKFRIGEGYERWADYVSWTYETTLAEGIVYLRTIVEEEMTVKDRTKEKSQMRQAERSLAAIQSELQELQQRLTELEAERAEWIAWKEADVRGSGDLTAMRAYLQEHEDVSIPINRNGVTVKIVALGDDAVAVTDGHGLISLNDEELQQGRVWVSKKAGWPIMATWLPIGEPKAEWRRWLQTEKELDNARSEIEALQYELAKYLPPPRTLLECTLRQWCALEKLLFQGKTLAGEELDAFLQESSERRLLAFIDAGEHCYFAEKHHQRRIVLIQQHLSEVEPYRGDPALRMVSMDDQGTVVFASGDRHRMDTEDIRQFWARVVVSQQTVGNTKVASLQQYLCDHPGESIEIHRDSVTRRIMVVDDDAFAVTEKHTLINLNEDDIEQAQRWICEQRPDHTIVVLS